MAMKSTIEYRDVDIELDRMALHNDDLQQWRSDMNSEQRTCQSESGLSGIRPVFPGDQKTWKNESQPCETRPFK
jgi:hypothetical protein